MLAKNFTDFENFVSTNPNLDARWMVNGKGNWLSDQLSCNAGDGWMMRRHSQIPFIGEGVAAGDRYGFYVPLDSGIWTVNSQVLERDSISIFEPGAEFLCHSRGDLSWLLFSVPRHLIEGETGLEREPRPYWYMAQNQAAKVRRVRRTFSKVFAAIACQPEIENSPAMEMVQWELLSVLAPLIGSGIDTGESQARPGLPQIRYSKVEIIHRAQEILQDRQDHAIHVTELANRVGVSERTLRRAFVSYYGFGPRTYLSLRLLHNVRGSLLRSCREETTVTAVLTRWGAWEFGRFSGRYKLCFGESPRETLCKPAMSEDRGFSSATQHLG